MVLVDRLSSALPGLSLLLLVALGCNIILSLIDHHDQQKSMAKESPMKATKKDRLRKIARGITPGILTTVVSVLIATFFLVVLFFFFGAVSPLLPASF